MHPTPRLLVLAGKAAQHYYAIVTGGRSAQRFAQGGCGQFRVTGRKSGKEGRNRKLAGPAARNLTGASAHPQAVPEKATAAKPSKLAKAPPPSLRTADQGE